MSEHNSNPASVRSWDAGLHDAVFNFPLSAVGVWSAVALIYMLALAAMFVSSLFKSSYESEPRQQ